MQPIGPLMHEHRLIERVLDVLAREVRRMAAGRDPDHAFIDAAVEFFRSYADRLHHGKEEDILFRELAQKPLSAEEARIMVQLNAEHVQGRALVRSLHEANHALVRPDRDGGLDAGPGALLPLLRTLVEFYPRHIELEDKHFFFPVMQHFNRTEMDAMLAEMQDFERRTPCQDYTDLVARWEQSR